MILTIKAFRNTLSNKGWSPLKKRWAKCGKFYDIRPIEIKLHVE